MEVAGSLRLLGFIGDALTQWGKAGEQGVPLVLLGLPELAVCAVEPVQHTKHPETLVELEVVEVVELGGGQEGKMVAAVGHSGADQCQAVPQAGGGQVGAQEQWA